MLSMDENDPIHKWRLRSQNLTLSKAQDKALIDSILNENDEINIENPQKYEKTDFLNQIIASNRDFDTFIKKSKEVLSNIKNYNETLKKSDLNIEILTAKTDLQNRLNELTFKNEFRTEEREKLKAQLLEISNIEAKLNEQDNENINYIQNNDETLKNSNLNNIKSKSDPKSTINSSNNSDKMNNKNNINNNNINNIIDDSKTNKSKYKIEISPAIDKRLSSSKRLDTLEIDPIERESKISLNSFIDNKKGIGNINKLFNQELEKVERKNTDYGWTYNPNEEDLNGKKLKNSKRLFENKFKQQAEALRFKDKPSVVLSLQDQLFQCYSCHQSIKKSFFFFWNTARYCHYSGFWHCVDCISIEKKPIPYKALEDFDLRAYSVSQTSQKDMELLYKKPILLLDYTNPIVQKKKYLYDFLILKRQLHLIYDMICNPILLQDLMQEKINLVLKENLFSLENFYDIYNGSLEKFLNKCIELLNRHINQCSDCQKKGVHCKLCKDMKKIFVFDLTNTSLCPKCRRLYHSKCLEMKVCIYCVHDT